MTWTPPHDSPCFMSPRYSSTSWEVFDQSCNKFHNMDFSGHMADDEIFFSNYGWLFMSPSRRQEERGSLYFFNPRTNEKLQLPPETSSFSSCCCFTAPPTSPSCCIFGIVGDTNCETQFALFKLNDLDWDTSCLNNCAQRFWPSRLPPFFHNGMYYLLDWRHKKIMTFDPTRDHGSRWLYLYDDYDEDDDDEKDDFDDEDESKRERGFGEFKDCRMVEVDGEIWGVFIKERSEEVRVEKLNVSEGRWEKVESLGERCFYVSRISCFAETYGEDSERANKSYFHKFYNKSWCCLLFEHWQLPLS